MKLTATSMGLMVGSLLAASPALAQYGSAQSQGSPQQADPGAKAPAKQPQISSGARKEIVALQTAVNAKDAAAIPAALAAAQAKAKNKDDQYVSAHLQLKAAVDAKDNAATLAGLQAVLSSGYLSGAETLPLYMNVGQLNYNAKNYEPAAAAWRASAHA